MFSTPKRPKGSDDKTPKRTGFEEGLEEIDLNETTPVLQWKNLAKASQRAFKSVNDKTTVFYNPMEKPQFVETNGKGKTLLKRSSRADQDTLRRRTRSASSTSREPRILPGKMKTLNKSKSRDSRKLSSSLEPHNEVSEDPEDQETAKDDTVAFEDEHIRGLTENSDPDEITLKNQQEGGTVNEGASCSHSNRDKAPNPGKSKIEDISTESTKTKSSKKRKRRSPGGKASTDEEEGSPQSTLKKKKKSNRKSIKGEEPKNNEREDEPETIPTEEVTSLLKELGLDVKKTSTGYQFTRSKNNSKVMDHFESLKSAIREVIGEPEKTGVVPIRAAILKLEEVLVGDESDELRNMLYLVKSSSNKNDPVRSAAKLIIRGSPEAMKGISRQDSRDLSENLEGSLAEFIIKSKIAFSEFWDAVGGARRN